MTLLPFYIVLMCFVGAPLEPSQAVTPSPSLSIPEDSYLELSVHLAEGRRQCCWAGRVAADAARLCHQSSCIFWNGDITILGGRTSSCAAAKHQSLFTPTVLLLWLLHCSFVTCIFFKNPQTEKNSWNRKVNVNQTCINIVLNPWNTQRPAYREGTRHNYWFQKFLTSEKLQAINSKKRNLVKMPWDLKLQVLHIDDGALSQTGENQWADLQWCGI